MSNCPTDFLILSIGIIGTRLIMESGYPGKLDFQAPHLLASRCGHVIYFNEYPMSGYDFQPLHLAYLLVNSII